MAEPRILTTQALGAGVSLALNEEESRHVSVVLRLGVGDSVRFFNAEDGEWRARIDAASKRGVAVAIEELLRAARPVPDLDLLFAPVKRHATDFIVEKATELGVRRIRPVITSRTIAETVRLDRLNAIAREAAEQTERFDAPEIFEPVSLQRALDGWDTKRALIYCDEEGEGTPILQALHALCSSPLAGEVASEREPEGGRAGGTATAPLAPHPARPHSPTPPRQGGRGLSVLIGPEGGFAPEERRILRACAFVTPVSLGPRILRAETAAIAALTIVQAAWGDWR